MTFTDQAPAFASNIMRGPREMKRVADDHDHN